MTTKKTTDALLGATHERGETHTTLTLPNCFADGIIFLLTTDVGGALFEKATEYAAKRDPKNMIQLVTLGLESAGAPKEVASVMAVSMAGSAAKHERETVSAEEAYEELLKKAGLKDLS